MQEPDFDLVVELSPEVNVGPPKGRLGRVQLVVIVLMCACSVLRLALDHGPGLIAAVRSIDAFPARLVPAPRPAGSPGMVRRPSPTIATPATSPEVAGGGRRPGPAEGLVARRASLRRDLNRLLDEVEAELDEASRFELLEMRVLLGTDRLLERLEPYLRAHLPGDRLPGVLDRLELLGSRWHALGQAPADDLDERG